MQIKEVIQEVVQKQGVTRYRIAKTLKVDPSNVYAWEAGRTKPNAKHLLELLRMAGRLAAGVLIVSGVFAVTVPERAEATQVTSAEPLSFLHIIRKWAERLRAWCRQFDTEKTAAALAF